MEEKQFLHLQFFCPHGWPLLWAVFLPHRLLQHCFLNCVVDCFVNACVYSYNNESFNCILICRMAWHREKQLNGRKKKTIAIVYRYAKWAAIRRMNKKMPLRLANVCAVQCALCVNKFNFFIPASDYWPMDGNDVHRVGCVCQLWPL